MTGSDFGRYKTKEIKKFIKKIMLKKIMINYISIK